MTAGVWQALSIVVLLGLMHGSANMVLVNLVMAAIFAGCAAFFAWRAKIVKALWRRDPDAPEMRRFVVVECLSGQRNISSGIRPLTPLRLLR